MCFDDTEAMTVEAYAGHLKDATRLSQILPAILIMYAGGEPVAQEPYYDFDILIVTESNVLNPLRTNRENLELHLTAAKHIKANPQFHPLVGPGTYIFNEHENINSRTLLQDARFTITAFTVRITDCT